MLRRFVSVGPLAAAALLIAAPALAQSHATPASGAIAANATPATTREVQRGGTPVFDLGDWHRTITTGSREAQRYFDQGLNLAYAFNHAQAEAAFDEAIRLDPGAAMPYWGKALVLGPNINWPMDTTAERPAWEAIGRAAERAAMATPRERALIAALAKRYGDPSDRARPSRASLDSAYAAAMRDVWKGAPDDADIGALCAEALMDLIPWNFWTLDGRANPGTDEIVATLETVLKLAGDHPGACHLYIHAVEASPTPGRAGAAARRLASLVPEAGHMVHMPGHIWNRIGRFDESERLNVLAVEVDSLYLAKHRPQGVYPLLYVPHNVHFVWSAAANTGRYAAAIAAARRLERLAPVEMLRQAPPAEFWGPTSYYTLARFGRWDEMLKEPAPPADLRFTTGMWHYARGLAHAAKGDLANAEAARESVDAIAKATPAEAIVSFNSAAALLRLAGHALAGEIAAKQGRTNDAVNHLNEGIKEEDALRYDEPPAWHLPVRQQLGAVLLAAGRAGEAEAAYREDLRRNPGNGWSLYGLAAALRARKATAEAAQVDGRFRKVWSRADVKLTASRY
jgi:tetratricopeptide (TPR) repeat protein